MQNPKIQKIRWANRQLLTLTLTLTLNPSPKPWPTLNLTLTRLTLIHDNNKKTTNNDTRTRLRHKNKKNETRSRYLDNTTQQRTKKTIPHNAMQHATTQPKQDTKPDNTIQYKTRQDQDKAHYRNRKRRENKGEIRQIGDWPSSWFLGFLVSWFLGFLGSQLLGCRSWILVFLVLIYDCVDEKNRSIILIFLFCFIYEGYYTFSFLLWPFTFLHHKTYGPHEWSWSHWGTKHIGLCFIQHVCIGLYRTFVGHIV